MSESLIDGHPWLEDDFLMTPDVAALLKVDAETIRQWCLQGLIRHVQEPISRKYLVCEADVKAIAGRCNGSKARVALVRGMGLGG